MTHRRRAFTMIEVLLVLAIVGLLLGLGTYALNRFRASAQMRAAEGHLTSELTSASGQARNSNEVQLRAGLELGVTSSLTAAPADRRGRLFLRVLEGSDAGVRQVRLSSLTDDTGVSFHVTTRNLPVSPLNTGDHGVVMELLLLNDTAQFETLATVPFRPDGTVLLPLDSEPGRFVLDLGREHHQVDISPNGQVKTTLLP